MKTFENLLFKNENLSYKRLENQTYQNCKFVNLILNDIKMCKLQFINCVIDHVFIEAFYAKDIVNSSGTTR